jgi:hypothetical protein
MTQKTTERIINDFGSQILGFPNSIDIISVCYIITQELGEKILTMNNTTRTGFYCSWPLVYWKLARIKKYIEVEGLEWETPDRFESEISEFGFDEWLNRFQSPTEWQKRVGFVQDGLDEMTSLIKFEYNKEF